MFLFYGHVYLSLHTSIYLSTHLPTYLSIHQCLLSTNLSISKSPSQPPNPKPNLETFAGYGDIGRATAKLAKAYGMRVLALRRRPQLSDEVNKRGHNLLTCGQHPDVDGDTALKRRTQLLGEVNQLGHSTV